MSTVIPLERGNSDGRKWIKGHVPVGKDVWVYIDTQANVGVGDICKRLSKFVTYQSLKIRFPSFSVEDTMQEIYVLIVDAIPSYELGKNTNILTFLQTHVKNRMINMCKYFSESRRRAVHSDVTIVKARCPECKTTIRTNKADVYTCTQCGCVGRKKWKVYNTPILPLTFSSLRSVSNNGNAQEQDTFDSVIDSSELSYIMGQETINIEKLVENKLDFKKLYGSMEEMDKKIIDAFLAGNGHREVAVIMSMSEKAIYSRVRKIIDKFKSMQG